ncbi:MAG: FHA domain-containing protein [Pyrinomonadaceae bacterium]|nr:FHA domain-containing protein [Pyrinomonadaceae bacterium]
MEVGSRLQFGPDGPILVVTRIESKPDKPLEADETLIEEATRVSSPAPIPDLRASVQASPTQAPKSKPAEPVFVELSGLGTARLQRIELNKEVIRFGRDQALEGAIDAAAAVVSRRHAEIRRQNGRFVVVDLGSFNGTLVNHRRIAEPELLHHNDRIELGPGGPTIRYLDPANPPPPIANERGQNAGVPSGELARLAAASSDHLATMVLRSESPLQITGGAGGGMFTERPFGSTSRMTIGRGEECNIRLDGLLISNRQAVVVNTNSNLTIEDLNSTNGTYVNGARITGRKSIRPEDVIQIGPFVLRVHPQRGVTVLDTRAKTRIDVFQVTKEVSNRSGPGKVRLLDEVSLSIQPERVCRNAWPFGCR